MDRRYCLPGRLLPTVELILLSWSDIGLVSRFLDPTAGFEARPKDNQSCSCHLQECSHMLTKLTPELQRESVQTFSFIPYGEQVPVSLVP